MYMSRRNLLLLVAAVALAVSFIAFGRGISGQFVFDDQFIIGNPLIDHGVHLPTIFTSSYHFHMPRTGIYRPLTIAMFSVEWALFGGNPAGFHVVNILLHALVVLLVFIVAQQLTRDDRAALITAGFFLLLPIHVEDVTSIVGLAELLALLWILVGIWAVLGRRYVLASLALLLGLFSKETAIALVPLWLFIMYFTQRQPFRALLRVLPYIVVPGIVYAGLRYVALGRQYFLANDATFVYNPIKAAPFLQGLWTSMEVFVRYLGKTFVPLGFSPDYSYNAIPVVQSLLHSWQAVLGLLLAAFAIAVIVRWRSSPLGFAALAFLVSYFVVSNWVFKIGTIMGERLMYTPSFGIALLVGIGASALVARLRWPRVAWIALAAVVAVCYTGQAVHGSGLWHDEHTLLENAYQQQSASVINQTNKAYLDLVDGNYDSAWQRIQAVLDQAPDHVPALNLAGEIARRQGKLAQAEAFWKHAIEVRSDYIGAYLNLGILYYENGYYLDSEYILTKAVDYYPRWNETFILSLAKTALGKYQEAADVVTTHFGTEPQERQLRLALGIAYLKLGDESRGRYYLLPLKDQNSTDEAFLQKVRSARSFDLGSI